MNIEKYISPFIESQFPLFYQEEGPIFIDFMKAYYEWMESSGNIINVSRSLLEYDDIDQTMETFLKYFKNKYINSLPENILGDKRLLIKHILDLYRSKGADASYKLLFRMIFNEDIDIYVPGQYIFKLSDNDWTVPRYIEVSDNPYLQNLIGKKIYSSSTVSTALVENYYTKQVNGKIVNVLLLSNLIGNFKYGEQIYCEDIPEITFDNAPIIFGSLSSVSIVNGGLGYEIGDLLNVEGGGTEGLARVTSTRDRNGEVTFELIDGGFGFSLDAVVSIDGKAVSISNITNTNPVIVTTSEDNGLSSGNSLRIDFVEGMIEINNTGYNYYANVVNSTSFEVYTNPALTTSLNGTAYTPYLAGGYVFINTGGQNASFEIGSIVNKEIVYLNTDTIDDYYNADLETSTAGYALSVISAINVTANSIGFSNTNDTINVSSGNYRWHVGDLLYYGVPTNNTAIASLTGNSYYYVSFSNNTHVALSTTLGGANVNITDTRVNSPGEVHTLGGVHGTFTAGNQVKMDNITIREIDCSVLNVSNLNIGETLSNSSLGIANVTVLLSDDSYVIAKGSDITNANLVPGVILIGSVSSTEIEVLNLYPTQIVNATANVVASNSTVIQVNGQDGYFFQGETIFNQNSVSNAVITSVKRNDNWNFPAVTVPDIDNFDSIIGNSLTFVEKEVGTIASLTNINPGTGYALDPFVTIVEPLIYEQKINDGNGGYKGFDAVVSATAGFAQGIVTSVKIVDSGVGYERDKIVNLKSANNAYSVTGRSVVNFTGLGKGYWKNKKSFISDEMYLQDSDYYQNYSYEIVVNKMKNVYENYVKDLVHPVGMKMFGKFAIKSELDNTDTGLQEYSVS